MGILLCLGSVKLLESLACEVFAKSVIYVLLREEDVNALETSIVRSHAVILQIWNSLHTLLRHILLSEHNGEFLCAVVAVVIEDNHIARFDSTIYVCIYERFHELVGILMFFGMGIVTRLNALDHIGAFASLTFDELVVRNLDAIPTLITVHSIETTDDGCDGTHTYLVDMFLQVGNESLT